MFLSMNWISDFVDLEGLDKLKLINQFSLSTAEVENEIFFRGSELSGVVVAEIISVEEHPKSSKLHLLKVDAGDSEPVDVVCGAPNVKVGMKTAFAKVGARLGEIEIAPRDLAGYTSYGMCCSEKEIGISDDNSGIMVITDDIPNGTDLKSVYAIDDIVFEVDNKSLTNRPDLWGHYGIAREFATLTKRELKPLDVADLSKYDGLPKIDMKICDPLCQRYSCLQVENITRRVSPVNMRIRLYYCGMRSINFLADMTNYLMLEMGQPMHAFDSRKVEKIRIGRGDAPFTFRTLDGTERKIDENTLMIYNDKTPVAIAGIMGGYDSEIVDDTTVLTLESATFDATSVRKSSVGLSLRTDASQRYEKCLDPEMTTVAVARFVKLLSDCDGGSRVVSSLTDEYKFRYDTVKLRFDKAFVDKYTGIDIGIPSIVETLSLLGFRVSEKDGEFDVTVPSWRATKDVTMKADIIEEITRIYGYDNFDIFTTSAPLSPIRMYTDRVDEDVIKDILVKRFALHELHSYIWLYHDEMKALGIEADSAVKLEGATNPNIESIRRSMIPTQLCQVKTNTSYDSDFGIFEIGRVVEGIDESGLCVERKKLAVTLFSKDKSLSELYFSLRNILSELSEDIRHKSLTFVKTEATENYIHPKNFNRILCDGEEIGIIGIVHPTVQKKIDKKACIVFAEIDTKRFSSIESAQITYEEPSRFPGMEVDLSFTTQVFAPIGEAIRNSACPYIRGTELIDVYEDSESGDKSITIRITFSSDERTLTREEVQAVVDGIISELKTKGIELKK